MKSPIHQRAVLRLIASGRATSQLQLARSLGAPANTIHGVVGRLLRRRVIRLDRTETYGRGRPIRHYRILRRKPVLAIEWLGSVWRSAVFLDDRVIGSVQTRHSQPVNTAAEALGALREIRDVALKGASLRLSQITGAALAINAVKGTRGHVWSSSVIPWIRDLSPEALASAIGCKVRLDFASGAAESELKARATDGVQSLALFNVGDGVSAHGVHFDSSWGVSHAFPGELGHVMLDPQGPRCGCGHRGCLEALISGPAMVARVRAEVKGCRLTRLSESRQLLPTGLFDLMEQLEGDAYVDQLTREFLDRVAWGVSVIANMMRPDVIVLGGYALDGREAWRNRILEIARTHTLFGETAALRLEFPRLTSEDHLRDLAGTFELHPTS